LERLLAASPGNANERAVGHSVLRHLAGPVALCVGYFAAAKLGLGFAIPPGNATAVWPPSGLAAAGILLLGYRAGWAVLLGAFAATLSTGVSAPTAAVIGVGNTLEALLAVWMFKRLVDPAHPFRRTREAFYFVMLSGVSSGASATIGVTALLTGGYLQRSVLSDNWLTWWLGDLAGLMVIVPLVITFTEARRPRHRTGYGWLRTGIGLAVMAVLSYIVFGGWLSDRAIKYLSYAPVILLIWIALEAGAREVMPSVALFSTVAVWSSSSAMQTHGIEIMHQDLFDLQVLICFYALTGLVMAGLVGRHRTITKELRDIEFALDQSVIVAITDPHGNISYVNDRFCEVSKYVREELLGMNARMLSSNHHSEQYYANLWRTIGNGEVWRGEFRNRAKDGSSYWVDTTIVPFLDEHSNANRYLYISFEITDRKNADAQFRRLFQAVEKTTDVVFITDAQGKLDYVNPAFEKVTGYSRTEAVGGRPSIMKSGEHGEDYYRTLWGTISEGKVFRATTVNRRKNGELFHAEQTITPVKDDDGNITHFVSVLKDITELLSKKEQEIEMRLAREVQQSFYRASADIPGFDIAGITHPAAETGGDYYDFIARPDGRLCIAIGDVCGHGMSSALIMAEARAYMRSLVSTKEDLSEIFTLMNRMLHEDLDQGRFVTLLMVCLDPGTRTLTYAGAGHEFGYLLSESGEVGHILKSTGPPLGPFPDSRFSLSSPLTLRSGQVLLLLTDGVTESFGPREQRHEADQAIRYVREHRNEPALKIAEGLCSVRRSSMEREVFQDDATSIILKAL
jgi:PAS domain S-box-containing protein